MKKHKKLLFPILAFSIPVIVFLVSLLLSKIYFKNIFYIADSLKQYVPTFKYYYNVLHGNTSFPYTLTKGIGGTMYGAFFYGLSSPINLLLYFIKDIELFLIITTLLRIGLSGITMYSFLKYKNNKNIESLIFSLCYSLCGYVLLYFSNIMWMDAVWIAPLLLIAINKIIKDNKYIMYILVLLYGLISNYYTGYMLALFSIIYFFYELYINYNKDKFIKNNTKKILYFFTITILVGLLISFILIPIAFEARNFSRGFEYKLLSLNYNILDIFSGTYIGFGKIHSCTNYFGLLTYASCATTPLIINYFTDNEISKKEKKASIIVLLLFILPVILVPLNALWHLFTVPNGFNYRYSFLLSLFIILLASKGLNNNKPKSKPLIIYYILFIIVSFSIGYVNNSQPDYYLQYLDIKKIIITLVLVLIYILLIIKKKKKYILFLIPLELLLNVYLIFNESLFLEKRIVTNLDNIINDNINIIKSNNDSMYRYETVESLTINSPLYYNYNGMDIFLSSNNKYSLNAYYKIHGIKREANFVKYTNSNILADGLFSLKYMLNLYENKDLETIKTYEFEFLKLYFQKNEYALPIGYSANKEIKNINFDNFQDILFLEKIYKTISNSDENILEELEIEKINNNKYIIKNKNKKNIIYLESKTGPTNYDYDKFRPSDKYGVCIDCNTDEIELVFDEEIDNIKAYSIDYDSLKKIRNNINELKLEDKGKNKLYGTINTDKNEIIILSIPYEKGWHISVDGKKVNYYEVLNGLIGIDINEGQHEIVMEYSTPGLEIGLTCSCLSLCILIVLLIKNKK